MKNLNSILLTLFVLVLSYNLNAQKNSTIYFGASLPLSEFASLSDEDDYSQGAKAGFNIGFQYRYPLSDTNFGIITGLDVFYNGLKKEKKEEISTRLDVTYSKFINIPISTGLDYTFIADDKIGVFANASVAWNFLKMTDHKERVTGHDSDIQTYKLSNNIGLKISAGIVIKKNSTLSI